VQIISGGVTQTDEIRSGGSYLSQNDFRLHFGLGSAKTIDSVEIRWTSGFIEKIHGRSLAIDKHYFILEGKGFVDATAIRPSKPATH